MIKKAPTNKKAAYRKLIAAVIKNAIAEIGSENPDPAMAFILSETCEVYCAEFGFDYTALVNKAAHIYRASG